LVNTKNILSTLRKVLGENRDFLPLHEPYFSGNESKYVAECIRTGWVSSVGKYVDEFEERLADYCGVERAVACVNGTSALHVCLQLAGVEPRTEVLMPSLTFVATANAVTYCGATPHFVDVEEATLGIDPAKLDCHLEKAAQGSGFACHNRRTGCRISAIVAMHTFGLPVRMRELCAVAAKWQLPLVEDAAESLGSLYENRHTGSFGLVSSLSFNGNKIITTGGGGAILTNDASLGDRAKHLVTTAKLPHRRDYYHNEIGYNYRMPNLNAALGLAQLEQLPAILRQKRKLAERYEAAFAGAEGLRFLKEADGSKSNYWLNALLLDPGNEMLLSEILDVTNGNNIMTRPAWTPMHRLPMYRGCPRMDLSMANSLAARLLNVPSSPELAR